MKNKKLVIVAVTLCVLGLVVAAVVMFTKVQQEKAFNERFLKIATKYVPNEFVDYGIPFSQLKAKNPEWGYNSRYNEFIDKLESLEKEYPTLTFNIVDSNFTQPETEDLLDEWESMLDTSKLAAPEDIHTYMISVSDYRWDSKQRDEAALERFYKEITPELEKNGLAPQLLASDSEESYEEIGMVEPKYAGYYSSIESYIHPLGLMWSLENFPVNLMEAALEEESTGTETSQKHSFFSIMVRNPMAYEPTEVFNLENSELPQEIKNEINLSGLDNCLSVKDAPSKGFNCKANENLGASLEGFEKYVDETGDRSTPYLANLYNKEVEAVEGDKSYTLTFQVVQLSESDIPVVGFDWVTNSQ